MPKCRLRPRVVARPRSRRRRRTSSRVLVDGARSAAPPISHGTFLRDRVQHLAGRRRGRPCPSRRPGTSGRSLSQPSGSSRCCIRSSWSASSGILGLVAPRTARIHASRSSLPALADARREVLVHAVGDEELARPRASRRCCLVSRISSSPSGSPWAALRVLLVRRALADVAVDDDQRRPVASSSWNVSNARSSISRSLASPTRVTFQP